MRSGGPDDAGRVSVDLEVANYGDQVLVDRGLLPPDQVRRETIQGVVGSRAMKLVLPEAVVKRLGLPLGDLVPSDTPTAAGAGSGGYRVSVRLLGRDGTYSAISDPDRETALIGGIVLGDLDLVVDETGQRLVPRDPRGPLCEMGW